MGRKTSVGLEKSHAGRLGTETASLAKTVPKRRNRLEAAPHFTERRSHFQRHTTCKSDFPLQLLSRGAVGNTTSCRARNRALAGAGSAARHTATWEGATYPTSAGLSAALLASQRSTTALDGTVTSWVCRSGEKRHNEYSRKTISPHPTAIPCA